MGMDGWTIFYWGWWISWAPFVGMFIAKISKGRTVGQVIKGAFIAPILFSFIFLTFFGSLGIKMQRAAEMALDVTVDKSNWSIDCAAIAQSPSAGDRAKSNIIALFFPYKGLKTAAVAAYNDDAMGTIYAVVATCTWFAWFLCLCLS